MRGITKVLLIIGGAFAALGVVFCMIGFIVGVTRNDFDRMRDSAENYVYSENTGLSRFAERFRSYEYDYEYDYEAVMEDYEDLFGGAGEEIHSFGVSEVRYLDIAMDGGSLSIDYVGGDQIEIETLGASGNFEAFINDEGVLCIEEKGSALSFDTDVWIRIPAGHTFEKVSMEIGATEAQMNDLECKELTLKVGAGNIDGYDITVSEKAKITIGAGYMYLDNFYGVNTNFQCGAGDVSVYGTIIGDSVIESGIGDVDFNLTDEEDDYNYEIVSGVGSVEIGSFRLDGVAKNKKIDNGADNSLKIKGGVGSIRVMFDW